MLFGNTEQAEPMTLRRFKFKDRPWKFCEPLVRNLNNNKLGALQLILQHHQENKSEGQTESSIRALSAKQPRHHASHITQAVKFVRAGPGIFSMSQKRRRGRDCYVLLARFFFRPGSVSHKFAGLSESGEQIQTV